MMIRHQSAMTVSIYIEIWASFLLWKSESKIKSVVQVAYSTKRLLAEFPNKTFATHNTVKHLQRKIDDIVERSIG